LIYAYVAFPEESISGIELLRRSGIPFVSIGFGGLGEGVCSLEGEGCPASECRQRVCQGPGNDSPFWQYFRQVEPGMWRPLTLGASATKVRNGDIDGWSWTPHDPQLPATSLADVARLAGVPQPIAATPSDSVPTAAVQTIYPPGVSPSEPADDQDRLVYLAAAGLLVLIGAGGVIASRRTSRSERRSSP
jgi:hypothetical protein